MTQSVMDFETLLSVSIYFSVPVSLQKILCNAEPSSLLFLYITAFMHAVTISCSEALGNITIVAVTFCRFWREPINLNCCNSVKLLGVMTILISKRLCVSLCLRNEYVYDSILLQSCVQLYYICLEAMSIFFFTCTTNSSSSPALLHFLLVQQLFCFIVWSQHLMPLIH